MKSILHLSRYLVLIVYLVGFAVIRNAEGTRSERTTKFNQFSS
jgi:hypothetical protein